jgi:hypothetical protein
MKQLDDSDTYQFECSGRTFRANCGIIGLSPRGQVSGGYDSGIPEFDASYWDDEDRWTRAECLELCNFMIALWLRTAAAVEERKADDAVDPSADVLESRPRA